MTHFGKSGLNKAVDKKVATQTKADPLRESPRKIRSHPTRRHYPFSHFRRLQQQRVGTSLPGLRSGQKSVKEPVAEVAPPQTPV